MVNDGTQVSFTTLFANTLRVELCRQGVSEAAALASKYASCVRLDGNGAHLALDGLGLGDSGAMAVAEALIKLSAPAVLRSHGIHRWAVALNQNSLTDRCATHLSLLVSRCSPPLLYVDVRENGITAGAAQRIEQVRLESSSPCVLKLDAAAAGETYLGSEPISASSLSSIHAPSVCSYRGGEMTALEKRRNTLFKPDRLSSTSGNGAPTVPVDVDVVSGRLREGFVLGSPMGRLPGGPSPIATRAWGISGGDPKGECQRESSGCSPPRPPPGTRKCVTGSVQESSCGDRMKGKGERDTAGRNLRGVAGPEQPKANARCRLSDGDDELPVDLTENLSPLLTSVMDLSDSVSNGKLRSLYDTDDIWSVVWANSPKCREGSPEGGGRCMTAAPRMGSPFRSVTVLCLSRNGLKSLEPLPPSLLRLDVSENELCEITGLEKCRMLTLLNARHNHIRSMTGFESNLSLSHLFLGDNEIEYVGGIAHLLLLETLDLANNKLETQASIRPLSLSKGLQHLMLRGNPVMEQIQKCVRPILRNLCPSLQFIDGVCITFAQKTRWTSQNESGKAWEGKPTGAITGRGGASASALKDDVHVTECGSYMHLLTRGVTVGGRGGYSNGMRMARAAKAMELQQKSAEEAKEKQRRASCSKGAPLRNELLRRLALDSKKYLEDVLAERLASVQHSYDVVNEGVEGRKSLSVDAISEHDSGAVKIDEEEDDIEVTVYVVEQGNSTPRRFSTPGGRVCSTPIKGRVLGAGATVGSRSGSNDSRRGAANEVGSQEYCSARVCRDEPLSHKQWVKLRGKMESRGSSSDPAKGVHSGQKVAAKSPERGKVNRAGGTYNLSPIHGHPHSKQAISTIAKQFLSDMGRLTTEVGECHSASVGRSQAVMPSLQKVGVQAPRVFSPSSPGVSTQAVLVGSNTAKRRATDSSTPVSQRLRHRKGSGHTHSILSPPPFYPSPPPSASPRRQACDEWVAQLHEDAEAVQQALQTVVVLIATQQQALIKPDCDKKSLHESFLQERQQCVEIIKNSGMLLDTEVPLEVVEYYAFTPEELNCTRVDDSNAPDAGETSKGGAPGDSRDEEDVMTKRRDTLNSIRLIGDAKTCLRYIVLLIEEKKERSLYRYVDEVTEFMTCEWEKFKHIETWQAGQ